MTHFFSYSALLITLTIAAQAVYRGTFGSFRFGQDSRYVRTQMAFGNGSVLFFDVDILHPIKNPTIQAGIVSYSQRGGSQTLFNSTLRTCDLQRSAKRKPLLKLIAENIVRESNFTLACPLLSGRYAVRKVGFIGNLLPMGLFSNINSILTLKLRLFEQLVLGKYTKFGEFEVNLQVTKR